MLLQHCLLPPNCLAFTNNLHAGTRFHKNFWHLPCSCSAVLTAIRGPLRPRRSQHYQPPPSLRWQRSSSCLPGLQPLPPRALSLLLFTVPETSVAHATSNSQLGPGMCCLHVQHLFCIGSVHWSVLKCVAMRASAWVFSVDKQWSSGWAAWAACCVLKALAVCCLFIKLFMALVQIY